jgi:tetratricopeptide (TPR) repeat protein
LNEPPADLLLANLYRKTNQPQRVDAICKRLLESPKLDSSRFVADFYASTGRRAEADQVLGKLDTIQCEPVQRSLARGQFYQQFGPSSLAAEHYARAVHESPTNATAWRQRLLQCLSSERPGDAVGVSEQAIAAVPDDEAIRAFRRQAAFLTNADKDASKATSPLLAWLIREPADEAAIAEALKLTATSKSDSTAQSNARQATLELAKRVKSLADKHPRIYPLQVIAAHACLAAGRFEDAIATSRRAAAAFPAEPEPAQLAAAGSLAVGRLDDAMADATEWKARSGSRTRPCDELIAVIHLRRGEPAAALKLLEPYVKDAASYSDSDVAVVVQTATAHILQGNDPAAREFFRPYRDKSPQSRAAWVELASTLVPPPRAAEWLEECTPAMTQSVRERVLLASAWSTLAGRGKLPEHRDRARAAVAEAARHVPDDADHVELLMPLASLHEANGDLAGAEQLYRRVLALKPNAVVENNLAMVIVRRGGNLDEAAQLAGKAVQSDHAARGSFYDTQASVHAAMKRYDQAILSAQAALKIRPDNLNWRINLMSFYAAAGQQDKATELLDEIESRRPDPAQLSADARAHLEAARKRLQRSAS